MIGQMRSHAHLAAGIALASALVAPPLSAPAIQRHIEPEMRVPRSQRKRRKFRESLGKPFSSMGRPPAELSPSLASSFKKLRRYYRTHPDQIPQPSEKAKLRHAWYRNKLAWDALREKLGQAA
jgi:hypothetical protein